MTRKRKIKHGRKPKYLYHLWQRIKQRCHNERSEAFKDYGLRGVTVSDQWRKDFISFREYVLAYLGEKPTPQHSLDRIDNDGNYEPGNIRWATKKEQSNNTRKNVSIKYKNINMNINQWAKTTGLSYSTIWQRIYRFGWTIKKSLTQKVNTN